MREEFPAETKMSHVLSSAAAHCERDEGFTLVCPPYQPVTPEMMEKVPPLQHICFDGASLPSESSPLSEGGCE